MSHLTNKPVPAEKIAIYPGTFDPITKGHIDLIERALALFDRVIVLVAHSGKKTPWFSAEERKDLVEQSFPNNKQISVDVDGGLLVEYARRHNIPVILRGLRGISDFEFEFQMATMNRRMFPKLQTFFLMSSEKYFFVNSTLVKEVFSHGGDVAELVPEHVLHKMKERKR